MRHRPLLTVGLLLLLVLPGANECRSRPKSAGTGPYADVVAAAIPTIESAVGLRFKRPPRLETRSKAQVRQFVARQLTDARAQRQLAGVEAAYRQLGMIPDTLALQPFLLRLLEEQIVGFYDPVTKVLYLVDGAPKDAVQLTITHELVHALQDQYVSLDSVQRLEGNNDRESALQAVFEGQAVYEQIAAMFGGKNVAVNLPGGWDRVRQMIRENQSAMPVFAGAPLVIQETLIFPYLSGAEFVKNYKQRNPGGVLYREMPVSTEQVMHPSAYFGTRDAPTPVTFAPLTAATRVYENNLGEFETRLFLYQWTNDLQASTRGATGWDGDRYEVFDTPSGRGIAWATVWDTPQDAGEYLDMMDQLTTRRYEANASPGSTATDKRYAGRTRAVQLSTGEIQGRPVVLYVDVPAGASTRVVALDAVKLGP